MNKTIELTPDFYQRLASSIATLESMAERNRKCIGKSPSMFFIGYREGKTDAYARSASMMKEIFRIEFGLEIHNLKTTTDDTRI